MPELLNDSAISNALQTLDGWQYEQASSSMVRELIFPDFVTAFAFMMKVALMAEEMNHHPDWFNSYKTVRINLSTHSAGGVTALDIELARQIDMLFAEQQG